MTQYYQLLSAQYLRAAEDNPSTGPVRRSKFSTFLLSVVTFCLVAIATMVISTAILWWVSGAPIPKAAADVFLWLDDWTQQLVNDAYSNR